MLIEGLEELIEECNIGPLTVERSFAPTRNEFGEFIKDPTPALVIMDPITGHNDTGRDLNQVPETNRNSETMFFAATQRFFVSDGGFDADIIPYQGRKFRVFVVQDYELQGGIYCCRAALLEVQNE